MAQVSYVFVEEPKSERRLCPCDPGNLGYMHWREDQFRHILFLAQRDAEDKSLNCEESVQVVAPPEAFDFAAKEAAADKEVRRRPPLIDLVRKHGVEVLRDNAYNRRLAKNKSAVCEASVVVGIFCHQGMGNRYGNRRWRWR